MADIENNVVTPTMGPAANHNTIDVSRGSMPVADLNHEKIKVTRQRSSDRGTKSLDKAAGMATFKLNTD